MRLEHLVEPESKEVLKEYADLSKGHRRDLTEALGQCIKIVTVMGY